MRLAAPLRLTMLTLALSAAACTVDRSGLDALPFDLGGEPGFDVGTEPVDAGDDVPPVDAGCLDGAPCDDGDPCTLGEQCRGGACGGGLDVDCDDGNACSVDECLPARGCVHRIDETRPECVPPLPCDGDCDDGETCTVDGCDPQAGECRNRPLPGCTACDPEADWQTVCDDGDPLTAESCTSVAVLAGTVCAYTPVPCDLEPSACADGNPCTADWVDDTCQCRHEPLDDIPCEDGDVCTLDDECKDGVCAAGTVVACDDQCATTTDWCDARFGCQHDGEACKPD